MAGIGGLIGTTLVPIGQAVDEVEADSHTIATYQSVVDATVPRTPDLGPGQETGALDVELEKYVIYNLEFGQTLPGAADRGRGPPDDDADAGAGDAFEVTLPASANALEQLVAGLERGLGFSAEADLGLSRDAIFGSLEGLVVRIDDGEVTLHVTSTTGDGTETETERQDELPLATLFATALDLYAVVFVLQGFNQGRPRPRRKFRGGGFFTFLAPADRIRCLLFVTQAPDALGQAGTTLLPDPVVAKKLTGATLTYGPFGYYSEWAGYGETGTEDPTEWELRQPTETIPGYRQIDYEGPQKGAAGYSEGPVDSFTENDWGESP